MSLIVNFPSRFAFTNADGTLTMEASRMLREWFARIGGSNAPDLSAINTLLAALTISVNDDKINIAFNPSSAAVAELGKAVEDMSRQISADASGIAELSKQVEELRQMLAFSTPSILKQDDVYASIF